MARTLTARIATTAALAVAAFAIATGSLQTGTDHAAAGAAQQAEVVRTTDLVPDGNPWD